MQRNPGCTIDVAGARVLDRDRIWHALDDLRVTEHGLFYARPVRDFDPFCYQERWVLPRPGWVVNRFLWNAGRTDAVDWYIEPEIISCSDGSWRVEDAFLDVLVHEGGRYHLDDAGELADAIAAGAIALSDALQALRALDALLSCLRENGNSVAALLREHAPSLPASRIVRREDGTWLRLMEK